MKTNIIAQEHYEPTLMRVKLSWTYVIGSGILGK